MHVKTGVCSAVVLSIAFLSATMVTGQTEVNYDEANVPSFELPDPLIVHETSNRIKTTEDWESNQRNIWLKVMEDEMFGRFPGEALSVTFIVNSSQPVFGNTAIRKEVTINVKNSSQEKDISLLLYIPKSNEAVPVFLGLNFYGNHTIINDPKVRIHRSWVQNNDEFGIANNRASEKNRGVRNQRWPVSYLLEQGYGIATIYYGEIDPDFDDNFENGIHELLDEQTDKTKLSSLSAWAWGLSQAMTYLQQDPDVSSDQVAVIGHSRLGKAALWAGAIDPRFSMVISNDSGCGGAALSRRRFGETVNRINHSFPHWFCDAFNQYNNQEDNLPFDQHTLLSLIAPRPLYVASAEEDQWADPKGEFLSARFASEVYDLYRLPSLSNDEMPEVNNPIINSQVAYHVRSGGHDITLYDWEQYVKFADHHFRKK